MKDWLTRLDGYITFNGKELLDSAGKISHLEAEAKALGEYEKYKSKPFEELTQVEKDFLESIKNAEKLLINDNK